MHIKTSQIEDRICPRCQTTTEDEIHFMVGCPFYTDIRHDMCIALSNEYEQFTQSASVVKFILMMNSKQIKLIAQTVTKMFLRRKIYE